MAAWGLVSSSEKSLSILHGALTPVAVGSLRVKMRQLVTASQFVESSKKPNVLKIILYFGCAAVYSRARRNHVPAVFVKSAAECLAPISTEFVPSLFA